MTTFGCHLPSAIVTCHLPSLTCHLHLVHQVEVILRGDSHLLDTVATEDQDMAEFLTSLPAFRCQGVGYGITMTIITMTIITMTIITMAIIIVTIITMTIITIPRKKMKLLQSATRKGDLPLLAQHLDRSIQFTCHMQHVTCHMSPATCHLSPVTHQSQVCPLP